eukprot:1414113-Rhodomonas_salina.1
MTGSPVWERRPRKRSVRTPPLSFSAAHPTHALPAPLLPPPTHPSPPPSAFSVSGGALRGGYPLLSWTVRRTWTGSPLSPAPPRARVTVSLVRR